MFGDQGLLNFENFKLTKFVFGIKPLIHSGRLESLNKFSYNVKLLKQNIEQFEVTNSSNQTHTYVLHSIFNVTIIVVVIYIIYIKLCCKKKKAERDTTIPCF